MAEAQSDIQFYNETDLDIPLSQKTCTRLASSFSDAENCSFKFLEIVYVDKEKIIRINKEHLERNYVTDIITFRYDENSNSKAIEGTLFCCAPRIVEQALELDESPKNEYLRIYIHGLLHLVGYEDKTDDQKKQMTAKENKYLKEFID